MENTPSWYNEDKLKRIKFEAHETGWAVDVGNGQYRLANQPIRACCEENSARWGDLVELCPNNGDKQWLRVIERYVEESNQND